MSLEAAIIDRAKTYAGLNNLIAGRIFDPDDVPQKCPTPYMTYQIIDVVPAHAMGMGIVNSDVRVQLDYYATSRTAAVAGRIQIIAAFNAWAGVFAGETIKGSLLMDHRDFTEMPDTSTTLKRESIDFQVSY